MIGHSQSLRDALDQLPVPWGKAFLYQGGESADEVDPAGVRRPFQGQGHADRILVRAGGEDHGDRGDRNPFIDDRNPIFLFDLLRRFHQMLRPAGDFVIHPVTGARHIRIAAVEEGNPHRDGAHIEVFLLNHGDGFEYIVSVEHECRPPFGKFRSDASN